MELQEKLAVVALVVFFMVLGLAGYALHSIGF